MSLIVPIGAGQESVLPDVTLKFFLYRFSYKYRSVKSLSQVIYVSKRELRSS